MNLVLFTHPEFIGSQSQSRFASMLANAYRERGHTVQLRQPRAFVRRWIERPPRAKWAGYVDQYVLFPHVMREQMRHDPPDTLYVFCDQALGPWVPQAVDRPHVVHCHDLLALRSALGDIPENPTSATGRLYQRYIRRGFRQARHFISISNKSRTDLHRFGAVLPVSSEVVYNGLNHPYQALPLDQARTRLQAAGLPVDARRCLLHVGGGQWYKNTAGVLNLYAAYVDTTLRDKAAPLPLWIVGPAPGRAAAALIASLPPQAQVRYVSGLEADTLEALYGYAEALLFPSLAEGFGWPIVEALACGCPVVTTAEAPMTEVGGTAANYLPRLAYAGDMQAWAAAGARLVIDLLSRSVDERMQAAAKGRKWAARFSSASAIDRYLAIYERVLAMETTGKLGVIA